MGMTVVVFVFFWFGRGFWVCGGMGSRRVRGSHGWVVLLAVGSCGVMGLGYFGAWVFGDESMFRFGYFRDWIFVVTFSVVLLLVWCFNGVSDVMVLVVVLFGVSG